MSEESKYVVVETTYPTNYGCHTGREWSKLDRMRNTTIEASDPFDTYAQAVQHAKETRDESCSFQDYESDGDGEPPYDSAEMQNFDSDEELLIQVMTVAEYEAHQEEREQTFMKEAAAQKFQHVFKAKMRKQQAASVQRVFYCLPPVRDGDYSVPAELEIDDSTDVSSLSSLKQIKSLMYEPKNEVDYSKKNAKNCQFFQILSMCTGLQELHLHMKHHKAMIEADFIHGIHKSLKAPHRLTVLAIQNCYMSPDAVKALAQFEDLQHLDIMDTFDYQLVCDNLANYGYDSDEYNDSKAPYEEALSTIGIELVDCGSLKRLDLGYGYDKSILKELVGADCLLAVSGDLKNKGGKLTTTRYREPADWTSKRAEQDAKKLVLKEIAGDEDPFIAAIAKDKLAL